MEQVHIHILALTLAELFLFNQCTLINFRLGGGGVCVCVCRSVGLAECYVLLYCCFLFELNYI
jgi:hypothetical protein